MNTTTTNNLTFTTTLVTSMTEADRDQFYGLTLAELDAVTAAYDLDWSDAYPCVDSDLVCTGRISDEMTVDADGEPVGEYFIE
jgi:hypothetical protein